MVPFSGLLVTTPLELHPHIACAVNHYLETLWLHDHLKVAELMTQARHFSLQEIHFCSIYYLFTALFYSLLYVLVSNGFCGFALGSVGKLV